MIKTNRLILNHLKESDQNDLINLFKDPLIGKTYMVPELHSKEEEDAIFKRIRDITLSDKHYTFGIYLKDKLIGFINDVEINSDLIEVGYFISSKEWNKGYASEALKAYIDYLFSKGFKRVEAAHFENNLASGRVMEKCGMHKIDKTVDVEYRGVTYKGIYYEIVK